MRSNAAKTEKYINTKQAAGYETFLKISINSSINIKGIKHEVLVRQIEIHNSAN